ncbi:hypothetical protein MBLNU457_1676t1 [Dothideomycetes sp. NU457]
MPPQSRGPPVPTGLQSKSTPNLPTLRSLQKNNSDAPALPTLLRPPSQDSSTSEPVSIEDFSLTGQTHGATASDSSHSSEDETPSSLPRRPLYQSRSNTYLAPPFYNRPPTPLPPSPSLTSLLRPSFSASRPTTPDPSSDEQTPRSTVPGTGTQTPSSTTAATLTTSFRSARPIPRASPKVPTYEYYGFTLYLTSSLCYLIYLLWSFLPSAILHQLGIYYYPNRWWSLAIPAWMVVCVVYIYVALAGYNTGYLTLGLGRVECLVDETGAIAVVDGEGRIVRRGRDGAEKGTGGVAGGKRKGGGSRDEGETDGGQKVLDWKMLWNEGTDAVMDVPIGGVCEVLYGEDRAGE